jgi:BCCT family betaine/carnitine transporter
VLLVMGITAIALISVLAGLEKGVQRLSQVNMSLAAILMLFVIIVGPTVAIFTGFAENLYNYIVNLPALSNPVGREDLGYSQGWTSFYWAWWIAWSPFVGMFIARVSRGRTVREFLISVLLIPSLACVFWMTVFGTAAIEQFVAGAEQIASEKLSLKLFIMLGGLPWTEVTSFVGIILVMVFFITSSDSGSLVIDTISAGGKVEAPVPQRIFWCTFEGLVAIALILGGGLVALQAMSLSLGLPFTIVLLASCFAVVQGLRSEPRVGKPAK